MICTWANAQIAGHVPTSHVQGGRIVAKHPTKTTKHATTWREGVKALRTGILFRGTIEEHNKALLWWNSACRKRASPIWLMIAIIPEVVDRFSHGLVVAFESYYSARPQ